MRRKALEQTLQTKSHLNIFQGFFQAALTNNLPIAVWRLPHENKQNVVVDLSGQAQQLKLDLEESRPGFAFSRFLNPDLKHTHFLNADVHYSTATGNMEYLTSPRAMDAAWHQSQQHFLQAFEEALDHPFGKRITPKAPLPHRLHIASEADYTQLVSQGVAAIKANKFKKVVLSRAKSVDLPTTFDHVQTFMNLCQRYANAMVYLVYIPNVGLWMGATPETLISTDAQQHFRTVALAGTQAYNPDLPLSHTAWMQKEIEEQAMVGRYIVNCFKKIRLREFEEVGPKTVIAGNLVHLCTHFKVDMQAVNFAELGTVMLDLLHPTSAVCGMPKETSQEFILEHEHYDRGFYSGFIGPVNIAQASHIFVNLRCMQILKNQAILYAGAGITEDSIPAREWHETEMKCKTMLDIIQ